MSIAFGTAFRAIERDRQQGIVALLHARGADVRAYVTGRVGGLVIVLAAVTGSASFIAGLAATSVGTPPGPAIRSSIAALVYSLAFSATLGPVCMAALGARSRVGGYVALLFILVAPELLSSWTSEVLPRGWDELTSIPAALEAVQAGAASPVQRGAQAARALVGLATVAVASLFVVAIRASRVHAERTR